MASVVKLQYYDESQYYNGEYHGDPVREIYAGVVYYDDNLTMAENAQRAYLTGTAGCQNFVTHTQVQPPSATTPQVWKREFCKTLTFGPAYARFCEELRYLQYQDLTEHFARVLAVNGGWSGSGVGQFMHVYDNSGTAYGIHYQSGSTYPLFTIDPTIMSQYHPPYPGYSYIKLLVSRNGGANIVRAIIHGAEMYNHPSPEIPEGGRIRREVYTYDLRSYGVTVIVEDIPDPPEPEDEMEIKQPYIAELFNRQYIAKRGHLYGLANYVCNLMTSQTNFWDRVNATLGGYSDWISCMVDITIFPFNVESKIRQHGTGVTSVRFSSADIGESWQNLTFNEVVYPITYRDCLFDGCNWTLISRHFNDFRDYPPYRRSQLYIPFIGIVDFDVSIYYGKYIKVKYAVDISCGGCRAFVCIANSSSVSDDGIIVAQYDGSMGIHCPVTDILWSDHFNQVNQALGSSIASGIGFAGGMVSPDSAVELAQMSYELNRAECRIPSSTSGSASSCLNAYCDYRCHIIYNDLDTEETTYLSQLKGYPSNASGLLSGFTGYLECSDVRVACGKMTEKEKTRFTNMLTKGIYI